MRTSLFENLDVSHFPRQRFRAGETVLEAGAETDRLLFVLSGGVRELGSGQSYSAGRAVLPLEFFGALRYPVTLHAKGACELVPVPRETVRDWLQSAAPMTWMLARSIAIETLEFRRGVGRC